jgi:predicted MPP superfamily phosphohydrolase
VNLGWLLLRIVIGITILTTLFLSQRFYYRAIWRTTGRWRADWLRISARLLYCVALTIVLLAFLDGLRMGRHGHLKPRDAVLAIFSGLWLSSAFFAFLFVEFVHGVERVWNWLRKSSRTRAVTPEPLSAASSPVVERLADPSRRYFFRSASVLAGATPFFSCMYGFAAERLHYQVRRIEIPMANLPSALDGMRIAQISDIHLSGYMSRTDVRRAVDMTNDLGADLAVVTGDFITGSADPIADCIEEVSRLHAPLGVWGCNGNHEIYAKAEHAAQQLFAQGGMKLLRQESAQLTFRGAQFNLIGVDYQRERSIDGQRMQLLSNMDGLIRRDIPNILLSHNPNSFNRAAELGIELSLAGHTHGGQIQVEILDHRLTPARFISDYIAGLFERPLYQPSSEILIRREPDVPVANPQANAARLYVNRGLGTVGAPVRLGVPPEISLLVLRRT